MNKPSTLTVLGIRHHGPGSARSVNRALAELRPDMILVEGPPDAQALLPLAAHAGMEPPVALLIYVPDEPKRAVYYPFAEFSPEWQAIRYGLRQGVPVRFMDLPQAHQLAAEETPAETAAPPADIAKPDDRTTLIRRDPLNWVAEVSGYGDGERWWEHLIEQRPQGLDLFRVILELMASLREETTDPDPLEARREAHMRKTIRAAQHEDFQRIAVICGAWHAPALADFPPVKEDNQRLKNLPKVKTTATWVPWTYGRLSYGSGYGAGIAAPGFYHHLWATPDSLSARWMARVAQLLREHDLDASTASVIEAVRLAESLAALRDRPLPDLADLNEAARAVFCFGDDTPLRLIDEHLCIGERLGRVPDETPMLPLQQDLQGWQKRLRLPPEAGQRVVELDLRKPNDLERSQLLHRLSLLGIPWGRRERAAGKGTFRENWRLQWRPELAVSVIEANVWGNTIADAAAAFARDKAQRSGNLADLTGLVEHILLANLTEVVGEVMARLRDKAALTSDIPRLVDALPPLADILRYGNVRQTDAGLVSHVVDGLITRICIGLPAACAALNDEAAQAMYPRLLAVNSAVRLLQRDDQLEAWSAVLLRLADQQGLHGLLAGRCCRLLLEQNSLTPELIARRMNLALSTANDPAQAGAWIEGFLQGSGLILLHNETLWSLLDEWVMSLPEPAFTQVLPLLRRTVATFAAPERRQLGERVKRGGDKTAGLAAADSAVDRERADKVLPLLARLLGLAEVKP